MKMSFNQLTFGALFVSLQALVSLGEYAATSSLNVMSFNLRTTLAKDPCPTGCWDQRKYRTQQMLAVYQPDLIGTQEGAPDQTKFFLNQLNYSGVGECAGANCEWNERNSIFYNSSRLELLSNKTYGMSDTPADLRANTWSLQYMRAAVIARFRDRVSGRSLCMLNTHYDINLGQLNSSQLVAKILNETCQTDDSVFMTGDLNAPPDSAAVLYLVNAGPIFGQYTPIPLYETLKAANAGGPTWIGGSFSSQVTENKIDYIFSRRDAFTCLQSGKVITDTFTAWDPLTATENRQSCSDHAVVQSSFCIGTGCTNCLV